MNSRNVVLGLLLTVAVFAADGSVRRPHILRSTPNANVADKQMPASIRKSEKIVGGSVAVPGEFPFIGSAQYWGSHFCGATYIGLNIALSAAHCFQDLESTDPLTVVFGTQNLNDGSTAQAISVLEVSNHPGYDPSTHAFDYAIIRLAAVPVGIPAARLAVNDTYEVIGSDVVVAGWGATSEGGFGSEQLLKVAVPLQSQDTCANSYSNYVPEVMICAGAEEGGIDSCQGDSGGPLIADPEVAGASDVLVGIVSFGTGCARPFFYGVYSKVSAVGGLIEELLSAGLEETCSCPGSSVGNPCLGEPCKEGECNVPNPHWVGDGICDGGVYNTAGCDYDGGDCCVSTCSGYSCPGSDEYCRDLEVLGCEVTNPDWVGDGYCDNTDEYNNANCLYDGGDCCAESCEHEDCGVNGYDCKDPEYANSCGNKDELLTCEMVAQLDACDLAAPSRGESVTLRDICPESCGCCSNDYGCYCNDNNMVQEVAASFGYPWIRSCEQALTYISCDDPTYSEYTYWLCPCHCTYDDDVYYKSKKMLQPKKL